MLIKIELENKKYCDGCPCLDDHVWKNVHCTLTLREIKPEKRGEHNNYLRPAACVKDNGE